MHCFKIVILGWSHSIITFNDAIDRRSHKVILNGIVYLNYLKNYA